VETIRHWLTQTGVFTAHPLAFALVGVYGVAWALFERDSFNWHAVATMAIWFMTLLIQRAEHRDTQAIQAKLDELLHAQSRARNHLTHIDELPEDIERHREEARRND
jgi:low affinity Fe/Cu permease